MYEQRFILFSSFLNRSHKSISRMKNKRMESYGLGSTHTMCLFFMYKHKDGVTKADLARLCDVDKALISRIIRDLTEKEYVESLTPKTAYKQKYILTDEGIRITDELHEAALEVTRFASESLSKEQIDNFYSTFRTICENLEKAEQNWRNHIS